MAEDRWRLEHVNSEDSESGFEGWNVLRLDSNGTDALAILQAWDEDEARHVLEALRWWDSFQEGQISIPKPPPAKKKPIRKRTKAT